MPQLPSRICINKSVDLWLTYRVLMELSGRRRVDPQNKAADVPGFFEVVQTHTVH